MVVKFDIMKCNLGFPAKGLMAAYGYKQTFSRPKLRSAYHPASDIPRSMLDFRF